MVNQYSRFFSPELVWEKQIYEFEGNRYGIIYTYPSSQKPVICKKDANELRKAAIYYRYNSQDSEIDYPELYTIIENEKQKINTMWMERIRQIGTSGIAKTVLLDLENGKITGYNPNLYIDESLLHEISFVEEGLFVETGGTPALKIVGQVQTVVGARKVVIEQEINKAINADEILKCFIVQENVNNPMKFIKQICYQNTGYMPVYYYLHIANKSNNDALEYINSIPTNTKAKDWLIQRISNREVRFCEISITNTETSKKKKEYKQALIDGTLTIPTDKYELKHCLSAIRGIESDMIARNKNYLLNTMYKIYTTYFNAKPFVSIKQEFRFALCWIDEALYMDR